jgi:hypothetical protein
LLACLLAGETAAVAASIIKAQLAACFIGKRKKKAKPTSIIKAQLAA